MYVAGARFATTTPALRMCVQGPLWIERVVITNIKKSNCRTYSRLKTGQPAEILKYVFFGLEQETFVAVSVPSDRMCFKSLNYCIVW